MRVTLDVMIADVRAPAVDPRPPARAAQRPFEDVLAAHEVELYRYLRRLVPAAEDAADLHQETFLRAFRAYDRLDPTANVRAWLYRIAGNLARDAHRRRAVRRARGADVRIDAPREGLGAGEVEIAGPAAGDPHARAEAALLRDAVRDGLLALTERQRHAVVARVLEGRDYADVAGSLGCSETTARQHVSQGLTRLRATLGDWMEVQR